MTLNTAHTITAVTAIHTSGITIIIQPQPQPEPQSPYIMIVSQQLASLSLPSAVLPGAARGLGLALDGTCGSPRRPVGQRGECSIPPNKPSH